MPGAATGAAPQATAGTKKKPPGGSRKGRRNHSQGVVKADWSQDQIVAHKKKLDREAAKRYRARCKARKEAEAEAAPRQSLPASPPAQWSRPSGNVLSVQRLMTTTRVGMRRRKNSRLLLLLKPSLLPEVKP